MKCEPKTIFVLIFFKINQKHVVGVLEEAEFYNITHLIGLVKEYIQKRDQKSICDNKQRVYRVLQCQENELTHVRYFKFYLSNIKLVVSVT